MTLLNIFYYIILAIMKITASCCVIVIALNIICTIIVSIVTAFGIDYKSKLVRRFVDKYLFANIEQD